MIPDVPYRFTVRPLPEEEGGGYLIEFPDLPGCMSDGETIEEAITNGIDAIARLDLRRCAPRATRSLHRPAPRRHGPLGRRCPLPRSRHDDWPLDHCRDSPVPGPSSFNRDSDIRDHPKSGLATLSEIGACHSQQGNEGKNLAANNGRGSNVQQRI
jgi:hypothetical protein